MTFPKCNVETQDNVFVYFPSPGLLEFYSVQSFDLPFYNLL